MKSSNIKKACVAIGCLTLLSPYSQSIGQQQEVRKEVKEQVATGPTADATQKKGPQSTSFWMDQKLKLSKELLEALATGDFEKIEKKAQVMHGLNRFEAFARKRQEGYRDQLRIFNIANKSLVEAAEQENLAAATLAFNQLTISCVKCHQHLRDHE